ncbi:hypothetical protein CASFOL_026409 [Castilleja foliolosa]|uniref:F-box associated beta-propeller type 1 domain-containing protein n=1 Tax=Castilleja foliolosa TaxID=1961234 RepID=A0ABD3CHY7_9LAMI
MLCSICPGNCNPRIALNARHLHSSTICNPISMAPASKGMVFKVAGSISSKLRYNNNSPNSGYHFIPKHLPNQLGEQPMNVNNDNKILLRRCQTNNGSNVDYFSTLSTDNNGFSLKKNYCFTNLEKLKYPSFIVGSCNGILCLVDNYENTVLWNPVTDELKSLPPSSIECPPGAGYIRSPPRGFGFDARSEDYKALRFVHGGSYDSMIIQTEIYSLKNDSWRPIVNPVMDPSSWSLFSTYLNGSCYWDVFEDCVLSYNFADEMFSCLPLPGTEPCSHIFFDIDGWTLGSIVYPIYTDHTYRKKFDMWVWKSNEWCWSQVDSFVVENVKWPLWLWGRDKCFLQGANGQLLVFDLTTRELMPLDMEEFSGAESLVSFEESTVSISKFGKLHTEKNNLQSQNHNSL